MNAFAVVIFFAAAAAPKQLAARNARHLSSTYVQRNKLTAADAATDDRFGESVAIDGDTVVVGAPYENSERGAVYVFRTSDSVQLAKLVASDAAAEDRFGCSVAIYGNTVVVGADQQYNGGSGSVYVLHTTDGGATYGQVAKLTAADAAAGDYFGESVAIDGDTIVVGASGDDPGGSVYVFRTTDGGATYDEVAKLTADDVAWYDRFGISVAIDGATIAIGAHEDDDGGSNSGSVYVFRTTDGATYAEVAKLTASDAADSDFFGISVAIAGGSIVVGASNGEAAYVFRTSNGGATYDEVAKLTADDAAWYDQDRFGYSVAIAGDTVMIGAPYAGTGGAAYVFRTTDGGATYGQVAKVTASDAAANDYFGWSVAIDGGTVVAGDIRGDGGVGSAYVFALEQSTVAPTASDGGDGGDNGGDKSAVAVIAGAVAAVALLLLLVGVSCFFYRRSKGSTAEPSGANSRPEPNLQPPKEALPAEEAAVVSVAPEAEESPRETLAEEPPPQEVLAEEPPPPAKGWRLWGAEPEPEPGEAERPPPLSPFSALRAERERELAPLDPDA